MVRDPFSSLRAQARAPTAALAIATCLAAGTARAEPTCARIADGTIHDATGAVIGPGFDDWGYNYNARIFWGGYCDAAHDAAFCQADRDVDLSMKWNDAWLSTRDCDGDGLLDRHAGFESYRGSGAKLINVMHGSYAQGGHECHWFYMTTIVAAPLEAELVDGVWYDEDNDPLGAVVWDDFYAAKDKLVDPCGGAAANSDIF